MKKCPKCNQDMEEGHLNYHGMKWVKGGINLTIKIGAWGATGQSVKAYRCKDCGFLENYAE